MLTEIVAATSIYSIYKNLDKIKIYRKWRQITFSKNNFTNKLGKTLKILNIERMGYGHIIKVELPYGYTIENLQADIDIFKEGLGYKSIQIKSYNNIIDLHCIKKIEFKTYKGVQLPANKLLIADNLTQPIIADMNKFPHLLLGGDTGSGKSRILILILTNLIKYCNDVDIHLLQLRKNDLGVFKNCKQVKSNSKALDEILETLSNIERECLKREELIDNTKGYYNIEDYNKHGYYKLKYIYVVIEEFSFLNPSRGDNKEIKDLKHQCLKYIKMIVNVGRSSGVFLITALQKPTNDSIPSDIKAQLCTRISLTIKDAPAAIIVLGNANATKLKERELICSTLDEEIGYSYTIEHNILMDNIKDSIIEKEIVVAPVTENNNVKSILDAINR